MDKPKRARKPKLGKIAVESHAVESPAVESPAVELPEEPKELPVQNVVKEEHPLSALKIRK